MPNRQLDLSVVGKPLTGEIDHSHRIETGGPVVLDATGNHIGRSVDDLNDRRVGKPFKKAIYRFLNFV